jgi:hypothetical protein
MIDIDEEKLALERRANRDRRDGPRRCALVSGEELTERRHGGLDFRHVEG